MNNAPSENVTVDDDPIEAHVEAHCTSASKASSSCSNDDPIDTSDSEMDQICQSRKVKSEFDNTVSTSQNSCDNNHDTIDTANQVPLSESQLLTQAVCQ